jgi:hypothetical protein
MKDDTHRSWDIAVKIVAPIVTVTGLLLGLYQFHTQQENLQKLEMQRLRKNDEIAFRRALWERQITAYTLLSNTVGAIAISTRDEASFKKHITEFYSLYWGHLLLVEDEDVKLAMIKFHVEIQDYLKDWSSEERLKVRASEIVTACRKSANKYLSNALDSFNEP